MELVKQPRDDIVHRHLCGVSAAASQRCTAQAEIVELHAKKVSVLVPKSGLFRYVVVTEMELGCLLVFLVLFEAIS